jgi:hypothetical protein
MLTCFTDGALLCPRSWSGQIMQNYELSRKYIFLHPVWALRLAINFYHCINCTIQNEKGCAFPFIFRFLAE